MIEVYAGRKDAYISKLIRRKAKCICRHPGYTRSDIEDIEHDLWVHLLERQPHFAPSRASFETFADRVIENKVRSILRHRSAQKRDARREDFSINEVVEGSDGEHTSRHETLASCSYPPPDCNDRAEDVKTLLAQLDDVHRAVATAQLDGLSKRQIGSVLGLSRRRLNRAFEHIGEVARGLDLHEYLGD